MTQTAHGYTTRTRHSVSSVTGTLVFMLLIACSQGTSGDSCSHANDCSDDERCVSNQCVAETGDAGNDMDDLLDGGSSSDTSSDEVEVLADAADILRDDTVGDAIGNDAAGNDAASNPDATADVGSDASQQDVHDILQEDVRDVDLTVDPNLDVLAYWRLDGYIGEETACLETVEGRVTSAGGAFGDAHGALELNGESQIATGFEVDLAAFDEVSVLAWVRTDAAENQVVWGTGIGAGGSLQLSLSGDQVEATLTGWDGTSTMTVARLVTDDPPDTAPTVTDGDWHHLAVVRDTTSDTLRLYVDGQLAAEANDETGAASVEGSPLYLGATGPNEASSGGLDGLLEDVVVLGGVVTQPVLADYLASAGPWIERNLACDGPDAVAALPFTMDFEGVDVGCLPAPWRVASDEAGEISVIGVGCNRVLSVADTTQEDGEPEPWLQFEPTGEDLIVEASLRTRPDLFARQTSVVARVATSSGAFARFGLYQGTFLYEDLNTPVQVGESGQSVWHLVRAELDVDNNTFDFYADDELIADDAEYSGGTADELSSLRFHSFAYELDDVSVRAAHDSELAGECDYNFDCGAASGLECVQGGCYPPNLLVNGDFDQGLTGWENTSGECGDPAVFEVLEEVGGRDNVLHMDSRAATNCRTTIAQTVDLSAYDVSQLAFNYTWLVSAFEGKWGQAEVIIDFYEPDGGEPTYVDQHIRTGDADAPCTDNPYCFHEAIYNPGNWSPHTKRFDAFDFVGVTAFDRVRIRLISYDNAGHGADAYFDDIRLYVVDD